MYPRRHGRCEMWYPTVVLDIDGHMDDESDESWDESERNEWEIDSSEI